MESFGRNSMDSKDKAEADAINKSLRVSSYLNEVYESIHTGVSPKINVPNLKEPTRAEILGKSRSGDSVVKSESESVVPMSWDGVYNSVNSNEIQQAMANNRPVKTSNTVSDTSHSSGPKFSISKNQWNAIQKYPSLVEFLGRDNGEKIARSMHDQMNLVLADLISKNSQEANEFALVCQAEQQNLKQYFKGNNWICRVVASGPFRGDEAIYYSKDSNVAKILRRHASGDNVSYEDISSGFNVIFEFGENSSANPDVSDALNKVSETENPTTPEELEENIHNAEVKNAKTEESQPSHNPDDNELADK